MKHSVSPRHCYMPDRQAREQAEAAAKFEAVEREHNLPAIVWWVIVCIASIASCAAGVALGGAPQ